MSARKKRMTPARLRVLEALWRAECTGVPETHRHLARDLGLADPSLAWLVGRLRRDGFVTPCGERHGARARSMRVTAVPLFHYRGTGPAVVVDFVPLGRP